MVSAEHHANLPVVRRRLYQGGVRLTFWLVLSFGDSARQSDA